MIFKKKYTRSEWMEGLLWAEEGRKNIGMPWLANYVGRCCDPSSFESDRGVEDYYVYIKEVLSHEK